jgi:hypothetical protein
MKFYMVNRYTYDGYAGHDQTPVIPFATNVEAVAWLWTMHDKNNDMEWKLDSDGDMRLWESQSGKSQYEYAYYWVQEMEMGKEID